MPSVAVTFIGFKICSMKQVLNHAVERDYEFKMRKYYKVYYYIFIVSLMTETDPADASGQQVGLQSLQ